METTCYLDKDAERHGKTLRRTEIKNQKSDVGVLETQICILARNQEIQGAVLRFPGTWQRIKNCFTKVDCARRLKLARQC